MSKDISSIPEGQIAIEGEDYTPPSVKANQSRAIEDLDEVEVEVLASGMKTAMKKAGNNRQWLQMATRLLGSFLKP